MAKRKAISKKTRFEVFKRDSFKCQYCGRSAPEVVLHVDHIKPIKEDGECDIFNYITSCQDCNLGKGARKLSDKAEMEKQKAELDLLSERREQIEFLMQWREELKTLDDTEISSINAIIQENTVYSLSEYGRSGIRALIKRFSFKEVFDAAELCGSFDSKKGDLVKYLSSICTINRNKISKPYIGELYYIKGILRNRLYDYERKHYNIIPDIERLYLSGITIDKLKAAAFNSKKYYEFLECFNSEEE